MNFKNLLIAISTVLLLSACGSSVKLDDVPVEDRTGTAAPAPAADSATATSKSAVAPVTLAPTVPGQGPAGVSHTIYFDYNSFVIKPEAQSVVESHARFLNANKGRKLNIEGHTDERGGREYNLALGQKRSEAVRRALSLLGVSESQMEAVSYGKEKPAVQGGDEAAWAKNRRAELTYR